MAKKEPNGSNDPLNEFNEDCNQSNSVVKQVKTEFKQEIKQEFKQEPFEAFEAREQEGINIIMNENFDHQSVNENIEIDTGKSFSEALLFAEHGENMLCTKNVLNVRNNFCTQHVLPKFELEIF